MKIGIKINGAFIRNVVFFCIRSTEVFIDLGNNLSDTQITHQFLLGYQCNDAITAAVYILQSLV